MKRSRYTAGLLVIVILLLTAFSSIALAGTSSGSGTQIRGVPGRNAQLIGNAFTVPRQGAVITKVNCTGNGFWIEGTIRKGFIPAQNAVGFRLPAGRYYVFPNLKPSQTTADVRITLVW